MSTVAEVLVPDGFPLLVGLLGPESIRGRREEFDRLGVAPLWQVERDLSLLSRHTSTPEIPRAYRDLLRNPGRFIDALYEIHVAAMLAPFVDRLELAPTVERGRCDLRCVIRNESVFVEVTTWIDTFPPLDGKIHARTTVERSFDPTSERHDNAVRAIPASKQLRDRIGEKVRQLPRDAMTVVVIGAPQSWSQDIVAALHGDEYIVATRERMWPERARNGIFAVLDDVGGRSSLSAVIWLKLSPRFLDIQTQSRLFLNAGSARALTEAIQERLTEVFDREVVLRRELKRIKKVLVDEYRPERIILFGSLAEEMSDNVDRIHQWSDIDLAIIKETPRGFTDRIGDVLRLVEPRVGLNVLVYTPEEFERAERGAGFFIRDEIVRRGVVLFP